MASGSESDDGAARLVARFDRVFSGAVPHNAALGLQLVELDREEGVAVIRLPYADRLVGNPETGALAGGAITSLLDASCGAAVFAAMDRVRPITTLDLRIDMLGPTRSGRDLLCRARCTRVTGTSRS